MFLDATSSMTIYTNRMWHRLPKAKQNIAKKSLIDNNNINNNNYSTIILYWYILGFFL